MGLRVLSLDGGGVLGYSELLILANIMEEISQNPKSGSLRPYDYFDIITGAGIGGVIALLLGRLRLTVTQCLLEYRTISTCILRDSIWGPLYDKEKVQNVANSIVKKYCHNDSASLLEDDTQISGKTFVFAVKSDSKVYCFRTYHHDNGQGNVSISISDAIVALLSAKGQLEEVTFKTFDGCTSFSDAPYPCGLRNPILHVLGEIDSHWQNSINLIVSIGTGKVPETDIPDLLELEKLQELSPSIWGLFQPWKWPAKLNSLMGNFPS
ncbi:FabD/lysophospholipase-like protein [Penicillium herquei]|nr:FabD/lysophospholipase-like protein [Penicillium herquei]